MLIKYENNVKRMKEILHLLLQKDFNKQEIIDLFSLIKGVKKYEDIPSNTISKMKLLRQTIYEIVELTHLIKKKKKIKLEYHKDVRDILKDIYKHV